MHPARTDHPTEPEGWADRVARARGRILGARTLDELATVLNGPDFAALPLKDLVALPTFGGARPRGRGVFSWDADRILVMSDLGDGFTLERRQD